MPIRRAGARAARALENLPGRMAELTDDLHRLRGRFTAARFARADKINRPNGFFHRSWFCVRQVVGDFVVGEHRAIHK